jgi:hypothetical protein
MDRLCAQELIFDPVGKAKSVALTPEGRRRCEEAYYRLFARRDDQAATSGGGSPAR